MPRTAHPVPHRVFGLCLTLIVIAGLIASISGSVPRAKAEVPEFRAKQYSGISLSGNAAIPQTSCGFVSPPADPSPMDCYTTLVANHDDFELGTRTPVILIHGIHGNKQNPRTSMDEGYFAGLIAYLNSNATFRQRFKIYRFHYLSDYLPIYQISRSLRNRIDDLVKQNQQLENKKFVLIAHSMGGLVARSYMNEHDTDYGPTFKGQKGGQRISKLITLATPHHGTYGSNDKARITGDADWGFAFDMADLVYWEKRGGCSACNDDPSHPNRSDLRFDNYNGFWDNNPAYVNDPKEQNAWLQSMPKTYDRLISAYYGYIGASTLARDLGSRCPESLGYYLLNNQDNLSLLTGSGVLLTRIELNDFGTSAIDCGSPVFFLNNDGLVPADSGMYKQGSVGRRGQCAGYNHDDMLNGTGGNCLILGTSISKPLFNLVMDDLLSIQIDSTDNQSPAVVINTPTSNSTFNTGNNSITLGGIASDNVEVTKVTWTNSRGGSGTASGTANWTISGIALQSGSNVLTVKAQDAAGNIGTDTLTVTYSVSVSDTSPPMVKISSPTSNSSYSTSGSTLTLRGTATDNVGVTQVTWTNNHGGSGTASGTSNWTANVTGLQSGTNLLTVRARDAAGNSGSTTLTVTYTPPPVCSGGTSENYRVNGGPPLHPNGTLIKQRNDPTVYLIQNGQKRGIPSESILNNLYQQTNGGFQDKDVITVASDELSRYPTGAVINSALPSNGRSQPDGRLIQRVGGSEISIVSNGTRRPFASESTFLGLGYLYCNVVPASDYDSYPVGGIVDAITTLIISSVTPSTLQTRDWGGSVTYTFTVVDGNGAAVSGAAVGGQDNLRGIGVFLATTSTDGNGQGSYTTTVPTGAVNGIFDIMFMADKAGYTGSDLVTRQVLVDHFQDSSAPTVTITSPTTNSIYNTNAGSITLAGTASDNVGVTGITWENENGGSGTASGTSNWTASGISLQSGPNVLTITARDAAGNIDTATITVVSTFSSTDTTSPTITITSPTTSPNYETAASSIILSGTASDNIGVTQVLWTNDRGGSGQASGTTNWTANGIALQAGFNTLTLIAQDAAGNVGVDTIVINYKVNSTDFTGPSLTITIPSDGQTVSNSSITISGMASDAGLGNNGISSVAVNGVRASGDTASGAGTANWSLSIPLNQGQNTITVMAKDASPNQNSTTRTITITLSTSASGGDLALTVITSPNPVVINNNASFTSTITNNGPALASGALFISTFPFPFSTNIVSGVSSQGTCSVNSNSDFQVVHIDLPASHIPDRFPSDLPLEESGNTVEQNYIAASNRGQYQESRVFVTTRSIDNAMSIYQNYFTSHGWPISSSLTQDNFKSITSYTNGMAVQISVGENSISHIRNITIHFSFSGIICNLGDLSSKASATVSVVAQPTAPGIFTSLSNVFNSDVDPNLNNNSVVSSIVVLSDNPTAAPTLFTEGNSSKAIALDSVTMTRDPFSLSTTYNFSPDQHTRIMLFAANVNLLSGENASIINAQAEDSQQKIYPLAVEYIGKVPNINWLTQLVIRLPDGLLTNGNVMISISLHGVVSNKVLITMKP